MVIQQKYYTPRTTQSKSLYDPLTQIVLGVLNGSNQADGSIITRVISSLHQIWTRLVIPTRHFFDEKCISLIIYEPARTRIGKLLQGLAPPI